MTGAGHTHSAPYGSARKRVGIRMGHIVLASALGLAGTFTLGATEAQAQSTDCTRTYTTSELSRDLGAMTAALRSKDDATYKATGQRLSNQIGCVRAPVPARVFASAYRHIGAYHYMMGQFDQSKRWFKTGIELEPSYEWDLAELALDHPLRRAFDAQRSSATESPAPLEGKKISPPAGATLLLDGRKLTKAAATLDRPHLLIVVGEDRQVRQVILIEGNAIPEQFLADDVEAVAVVPTKGKGKSKGKQGDEADPEDAYATRQVSRVRPPAKTPLMVTGGALAIAGGALYATSFATRSKFDASTTQGDLDKYKRLTNTLVVSAGATIALGVGVEYVGIIISEQPGLALRGRF